MENLACLELPQGVEVFIYADDVCIVSSSPRRPLFKMQEALQQIEDKCTQLGLKINKNKTKAMAIKHGQNPPNLLLKGDAIEWVDSYTYLGVCIANTLSPEKEIQLLKDKTRMGLNALRRITTLQEGATYHLLRKFYMQTVRAQVEYAAPVLTCLRKDQQQRLEVIQNNAMRLMLGAPMWTRICLLRAETQLQSLTHRISQRNAAILCKTIRSDRDGPLKQKMRACLNLHEELNPPKTYAGSILQTLRLLDMQDTVKNMTKDVPPEGYQEPAPWVEDPVRYNFTVLPASKALCTAAQMRTAAKEAIRSTAAENTYYTDGSVDLQAPATAAAVVAQNFKGSWRLSNNASILQAELLAVLKALEDSIQREGHTTVHIDSKGAILALKANKPKENVTLITAIKSVARSHQAAGRRVVLNWIPSHVGIQGNEEAGTVSIKMQPSLTQLKEMAKKYVRLQEESEVRQSYLLDSRTAKWYVDVTNFRPHDITMQSNRKISIITHRLRLGYLCTWQLIGNEDRPCQYCDQEVNRPLAHYLMDCPETRLLRSNLTDNERTPEQITRHILNNMGTHEGFLMTHPPPR